MKTLTFLTGLLLTLILATQTSLGQTSPPKETSQFDFWVGDWELTWKTQSGQTQTGSNRVEKILGGFVIQENFDGGDQMPLKGISHSVFHAQSKKWRQTWVDNSGSYLDFIGEFKNGEMTLQRELASAGKKVFQRMRFYNIKKDSLDWDWESSQDGENWNLVWRIHYQRK